MLKKLIVNGYEFICDFTYKNNKRLYLRIKNNKIYVTAPINTPDSVVVELINKNYDKIYSQITADDSSVIHYLGKEYPYKIFLSDKNKIILNDDMFYIYTKKNDLSYIKSFIRKVFINELKKLIKSFIDEAMVAYSSDIVGDINIEYKYLKSVFGKCYPKQNKIVFSAITLKLDIKYIKLIVFHEFTHLRYPNHQKEFYDYLGSKLINAKKLTKELNKQKIMDLLER